MFEEIVTKDGLKFNGLEKKIYKLHNFWFPTYGFLYYISY